jgi:hypothetical protein
VLVGKFAALKIVQRPQIGVEARDFAPSPKLAATDAGGNLITQEPFGVYAFKQRGIGELLSRNAILFRSAVNGEAEFDGLFVDLPSPFSDPYEILFNATLHNITAAATLEGLQVCDISIRRLGQEDGRELINSLKDLHTDGLMRCCNQPKSGRCTCADQLIW